MTYLTVGNLSPHYNLEQCCVVLFSISHIKQFLMWVTKTTCNTITVISLLLRWLERQHVFRVIIFDRRIIAAHSLLQSCLTFQLLLRPWQDTRHAIRCLSTRVTQTLSPCKECEQVRVFSFHTKLYVWVLIFELELNSATRFNNDCHF